MSYTQLIYHIVLRTYRSERTISEAHERDLYNYMFGFIRNNKGITYRIGGMPDHVHLLVGLHPTQTVSSFVQQLKISTSKWLKANPDFPFFDGWTKNYGAFTVSSKSKETVVDYIRNQKEHHRVVPLAEELRQILVEEGIPLDERFFLVD